MVYLCAVPLAAAEYRVGLFIPENSSFWSRFALFSQSAAAAVGMKLEIHDAKGSTSRMLEQVNHAAEEHVNAFLFMEYDGIGEQILKIAENHRIPAFLFNTGLDEASIIPRNQYRYWIGGVLPDDQAAGVRLATELINAAQKNGESNYRILAFTGQSVGRSYARRYQGLLNVVKAHPEAALVQALTLDEGDSAAAIAKAVETNPNINIIWSVNDGPALFAAKHYRKLVRGKSIVSGGIDWTPEVLSAISNKELSIDLGGHIFDGAQAVIMVFDYLNGYDFTEEGLLFESNMVAAQPQNVGRFQHILADPDAIDYKALSKHYNRALTQYRFDLNAIAEMADTKYQLNHEERHWINEHPIVRYGAEKDWPPYDFTDNQGKHTGYVKDFLGLVGKYSGLKFQADIGNWNSLVEKTRAKKLDLLPLIIFNDERKQFLNFTEPYVFALSYFFVHDSIHPTSLDELNGRTIAIPKGYGQITEIKQNFPKLNVFETATLMDAIKAVLERKADVMLESYSVLNYTLRENSITSIRPFKPIPNSDIWKLRMATRKDWPMLAAILEKTLHAIPQKEKQVIYDKWLDPKDRQSDEKFQVNTSERQWLNEHPVIRFIGDPNWLPYEAFDSKGQYIGMVADYLRLLEKKLHIVFEIVPTHSWSESKAKVKRNDVDALSETTESDLKPQLKFTHPYLSGPIVILMRDSEGYVDSIDQIKNRRIAVIKDYDPIIFRRYPTLKFTEVKTIQDGLTAVSTGKVDALLATLAPANYYLGSLGIDNVRIVGKTEFMNDFGLGVRNEYAPLVPLLNRALDSVSEAEKRIISDKWGKDRFVTRTDYLLIAKLVFAVLVLFLLTLLWIKTIQRQKRQLQLSKMQLEEKSLALVQALTHVEQANIALEYKVKERTLALEQEVLARTQTEEQSKLILDNAGDGIVILDALGNIKGFNQAAQKMFGFTDEEVIDKAAKQLFSSTTDGVSDHEFALFFIKAQNDLHFEPTEILAFRKDLSSFPVEISIGTSVLSGRRIYSLIVRDISDRKLAEEQLKEKEAFYRGIIQASPDSFVLADTQGYIIQANDNYSQMSGYTHDELRGKHARELVIRTDAEIAERMQNTIHHGKALFESNMLRKDGTVIPTEVSAIFLPIAGGRFFVFNRDISDRKRAEKKLLDSEKSLREAQRIAQIGNWEYDIAKDKLEWSDEVYRITELDRPDFSGNYAAFKALVHPEERALVDSAYQDSVKNRREFNLVHRILLSDGRTKYVHERGETYYDEDRPLHSIGTVQDVTEVKLAEEELQIYRTQLEFLVKQRTVELEAVNQELEAFAYSVSHDLRAPLRSIDGFSRALMEDYSDKLDAVGLDYLNRVCKSSQRMGELIDDLLKLSRITRQTLDHKTVDLSRLAQTVLGQLQERVPGHRVETAVENGMFAYGDPGLLKIVLDNLLGNAWKYSSKQANPQIAFGSIRQNGDMVYYVSDNGVGFDMLYADKLFGAFQRLHSRSDFEGTGIGLATVKRVILRHGGRIWAVSERGLKTTFYFTLSNFETELTALQPSTNEMGSV